MEWIDRDKSEKYKYDECYHVESKEKQRKEECQLGVYIV